MDLRRQRREIDNVQKQIEDASKSVGKQSEKVLKMKNRSQSYRNSCGSLESIKENEDEARVISPEKAEDSLEQLTTMLKSVPDAGAKPVELWSKVKPLTPEFLQPYWDMVESGAGKMMTDLRTTEYATW